MKYNNIEVLLRQILNPTDLEVNTMGVVIGAKVWLQNMIIDIAMVKNKIEIKVVASPKARENPRKIEDIIIKIYKNINSM